MTEAGVTNGSDAIYLGTTGAAIDSHRLDFAYHVEAASRAFFANRHILCNKAVSLVKRLQFLNKITKKWVVPAGVSSALAVLGGEISTRIDSSTVWGGGSTCGRISLFAWEGGGRGLGYRFFPGPVSRVFARVDPT